MSDKPSFEMRPDLRKLTEKNIEQARASFAQFMDYFTQVMGTWSGSSSSALAPGFKAVQDRAIEFAKENAEGSFQLASDLANAKDIQQMLAIQNRYAQTQIQANSRQAQELVQLMSKALSDPKPKTTRSEKPKAEKPKSKSEKPKSKKPKSDK
jgi:hypothetical protein